MQISPASINNRLDLARPVQRPVAYRTPRAYATWCLVVLMLVAVSFQAFGSHANNIEMVGAYGLQSSAWSWQDPSSYGRLVSYAFLHGSAGHFFWNTLLLLLVGCVIEYRLGLKMLAGLFLLGASLSGVAHLLLFPAETSPLIGASGAISALFGAAMVIAGDTGFALRLPRTSRRFALTLRRMLLLWLGIQVVAVSQFLVPGKQDLSVAYWVHIAGFGLGVAMVQFYLRLRSRPRLLDPQPEITPSFSSAGD